MKQIIYCLMLITLLTLSIAASPGQQAQTVDSVQTKSNLQANEKKEAEKAERERDMLIIRGLIQLADKHSREMRYDESILLHQAATSILSKTYGTENPKICEIKSRTVELLRKAGRLKEANEIALCNKNSIRRT